MRHRGTVTLVTTAVLGALLAVLAPVSGGPPTKEPLFAPKTTWTYRDTRIEPSGKKQTGTMTVIYGGTTTHQGRTLHFFDAIYSNRPTVERVFQEWTGTHFRQIAGKAQVIVNGTLKETPAWTYTSSARGTVTVKVPAGTFQATRWETVWKIGDREQLATYDTVGLTDVRWESTSYASGSQTVKTTRELVRGPVK